MSNLETAPALLKTEPLIAAIDNGGTKTRIEVRQGDVSFGRSEYPTPHDYETALNIIETISINMTDGQKVQAVGFAIAGKINDAGDQIVAAGELQNYGWVEKPFKGDVAIAFGIEFEAVVLLNDCVAAAKAQQVANKKLQGAQTGYVEAISTGVGGAGFNGDRLIPDEPGHEFLKPGAICGCGKNGCVEAHISGSGIERKYGMKAENLPEDLWKLVVGDTVEAEIQLLNRLAMRGFSPESIYMFGSVAVKSPYVIPGLKLGLSLNRERLISLPQILEATHGEDGGLVGAGDAAAELFQNQ